jgi:hypothetical protein
MRAHSYKKRRSASVISLSRNFQEAVQAIRSDLGIPEEGFLTSQEMIKWYKKHHKDNTEKPYRPMPRYYWHIPKEFAVLIESFSYSDEPSRANYYPDVPLDRYAMGLVRAFDLPEEIVDQVKGNILGKKESLSVGATLQLILIPVNEREEGIKYLALIAGIDESSTQKDWLETWNSIENILRMSGKGKAPHKRPSEETFLRDLGFWKRIKGGKAASEVVDDWIKIHPEDKNYPAEDTIRKAVDRIEKIMRPDT